MAGRFWIIVSLVAMATPALAQLPELDWSIDKVNGFMKGKVANEDTVYASNGDIRALRFGPFKLHGYIGLLAVTVNVHQRVKGVMWVREDLSSVAKGLTFDSTLKAMDADLTSSDAERMAEYLQEDYGRAKRIQNSGEEDKIFWTWKKSSMSRALTFENGELTFFYSKP